MTTRKLAFRLLNYVSAWSLTGMAYLAQSMGDRHEVAHISAMLDVGHSTDCTSGACTVLVHRWLVRTADEVHCG